MAEVNGLRQPVIQYGADGNQKYDIHRRKFHNEAVNVWSTSGTRCLMMSVSTLFIGLNV